MIKKVLILYTEQLKSKDELITELREQISELKKEVAELRKQVK